MKSLKYMRQKMGKTQKEVSNALSIPQTTLYSYESGVCDPSIDTLIKLADYYYVSIDELVGRESNNINLEALPEEEKTLIQKIMKMNQVQKAQTINFVNALTMFDK